MSINRCLLTAERSPADPPQDGRFARASLKLVTCFALLLQDGVSFEVRRYDAAKYATVSSEGRTFDQISGELVRKLLMYIGGSNEQGKPGR